MHRLPRHFAQHRVHEATGALDHLMKNRTCIVIAHHLGTIRNADVIFVVKDAEVVERGTHAALMAQGGVYARLNEIQATA